MKLINVFRSNFHCDMLQLSLQYFYFITLTCFLTISSELQINFKDAPQFLGNETSTKFIVTLY